MKKFIYAISLLSALLLSGISYTADGGPPKFFKDTMPEAVMPGILGGWGAMKSKEAPLDAKTTELIALAVAAQIPCEYCVYAHAATATKLGASAAELKHAVAVAGFIRMFSTSFHGMQYDFDKFKAEYDKRLSGN